MRKIRQVVPEEWLSQTNAMGRVGWVGWVGNYLENNATSWPILQAETFQIFS